MSSVLLAQFQQFAYTRGMEPRELTAARISLGLTQKALAERFGVHPMTVNKWEHSRHRIPSMVRLALVGLELERQRVARRAEA